VTFLRFFAVFRTFSRTMVNIARPVRATDTDCHVHCSTCCLELTEWWSAWSDAYHWQFQTSA